MTVSKIIFVTKEIAEANNNNHTVTGNAKQVLVYVGGPCIQMTTKRNNVKIR